MAETRTRVSCQTDCAALEPSVDVLYTDVWTDPAVATPSAPISYLYSNLDTTAPVNVNCIGDWTTRCRIVINYETHIHPLWNAPRLVLDGMGDVDRQQHLRAVGLPRARQCGERGDGAGGSARPHGRRRRPTRRISSTRTASCCSPTTARSWSAARSQDEQVQIGIDAMGNPILAPVSIAPSMSAAGARVSRGSSACFDVGGTAARRVRTRVTCRVDELRLVAGVARHRRAVLQQPVRRAGDVDAVGAGSFCRSASSRSQGMRQQQNGHSER